MESEPQNLDRALSRLVRRARAARWLRLSGRALFLCGAALFLLFGTRRYFLEHRSLDILPWGTPALCLSAAGGVLAVLLALRLVVRFAGPGRLAVARHMDRRLDLHDLASSGLAARGHDGPLAREVVRRAGEAAEQASPERLYPVRRSLLAHAAALPFLLAALYLFALPPWAGWDPFRRGPSHPAGLAISVAKEDEGEPASDPGEDEPPEPPPPPAEREGPRAAPDRILARVIPAKEVYEPRDPVTIFVQARPGDPIRSSHTLVVALLVDGEVYDPGETLTVGPGKGSLITVLGRLVPGLGPRLTPGKHSVAAILTEGDRMFLTPPEEFEIRGEQGGGGGGGGAAPPPTPPGEAKDRLVIPLFGPGETVRKKGVALVPDPDAPAGSPPRRMPLSEAAREAGRRPETAVPTERVAEEDRSLVTRYFDLLRDAR